MEFKEFKELKAFVAAHDNIEIRVIGREAHYSDPLTSRVPLVF